MRLIERYIIRQIAVAFLLCLVALSAVVWMTQALREFDLLTAKGQTVLLFAKFTLLLLPTLVMVIAPVALFIACIYTLNRLNRDSELVILFASGASRCTLVRPFLIWGLVVTLALYAMSLHFIPESFREMRQIITYVRADVLTNIIKPGRFVEIEEGLTFHIRNRRPDGTLEGLMMHDTRQAEETLTYLAREGLVSESDSGTYLVMLDGVIQRQNPQTGQTLVAFERYAFDLSQFSRDVTSFVYKPREKTTAELIWPPPNDHYYRNEPGQLRSELVDRFTNPLYALVFVLVALSTLGYARSNRQKTAMPTIMAIVAVVLLRGLGFVFVNLTTAHAAFAACVVLLPLVAIGLFGALSLGSGHTMMRLGERLDGMLAALVRPLARGLLRLRAAGG